MPKATDAAADDRDVITSTFLDQFNKEKQAIESTIDAVMNATRNINSLMAESQTAFSPEDLDKISAKLADCVKRAQNDAQRGKKLLDDLKQKGESLLKSNPNSDRLQPYKSQYMRLCKLYVDAMKEHQRSKEQMRKLQLDTVVRRAQIAYGGTKTEAELREMAAHDPAGLIREAIMDEASEEAQQAFSDAQSRARDVEMLVRSLNEVAALFQDLAVLVQHQSEMLDSIEENVETAGKYVRKGNQNLRDAIESQKKARKCMCCLMRSQESAVNSSTMQQFGTFANIGSFDIGAALKANDISADVQRHLVKVYALLATGVAVAGAGAWAGIDSPMMSTLGTVGVFGLIFALAFQQDKSMSASRVGLYLAFAACQGLAIAGLVGLVLSVDPSILVTALLGTSGTFAAFTLGALLSKRRSLLYLGGVCGSVLSWLLIAGLVNMFMRSQAVFTIELYAGLFMFLGFVVFDSQMIVERAALGDADCVGHATTLLVDFVALFVRIAIILLRNQEKREDRERRNNRR